MKQDFIAHRRQTDSCNQPLIDHITEASFLAGKFSDKIGVEYTGRLIGFLHDLGKASGEFDRYIRSATGEIQPDNDEYIDADLARGTIDHSTAGAQYIYRLFKDGGKLKRIAAEFLSICIASHHSGLIDCLTPSGENNLLRRLSKDDAKTHLSEAIASLDETERTLLADLTASPSFLPPLIASFQKLKEDGDSQETLSFKYGLLIKYIFSCLIDADRLSTADFEFPENKNLRYAGNYIEWADLIKRFDEYLSGLETNREINRIRRQVSEACYRASCGPKGIYQLTVPTGGGKTLASMRFALHHANRHKMDRIFYFIPFNSIIDQNADEIRTIFNKDRQEYDQAEIVLEHHSNLTPEIETKRQRLLAENWDAPIVFSTNVQFLEGWFGFGTRNMRRIHQLSNSVIIFDEVQTIPIRCIHMFNTLVRFLVNSCGATVVLCTATQPLLGEVQPKERALPISPDHEIISGVQELYDSLKRVQVFDRRKAGGWTDAEIQELTAEQLRETGSVLVVVNTKAAAQSLFMTIAASADCEVYHLSTNMCPAHRMHILGNMRSCLDPGSQRPVICISTQLIEAGIDIDFGTVIRSMAGLDSIAQAAGRCNRHKRRGLGNVFIVNIAGEKLDWLRDIKIASEIGERVLDEFAENPAKYGNDILHPELMKQFYRYHFHDRKDEMKYRIRRGAIIGHDDDLYSLLSTNIRSAAEYQRTHQQTLPPLCFRQSFAIASKAFRAIDSPARGVIVPYGEVGKAVINDLCAAYMIEKAYKLIKKAQRYAVNVFPHIFEELVRLGAIREVQENAGIYYLDGRYYHDDIGLSREIVNEMESLIA